MVSLDLLHEHVQGAEMVGPAVGNAARRSTVFYASALTIIASLLLGGGTRGGFLSDAILEALAIPALMVSMWSFIGLPWRATGIRRRADWVLVLTFAVALLPLLQLIPLPPRIWTKLSGGEGIETILELGRGQLNWMPMSVSPNSTWLSLLSLIAPLAIFFGMVQLGYQERRRLSLLVIALGVAGAFVGLVQVAQGRASPLRFFALTNDTEAVGFFANRNHFAALLYACLLFSAAWAIDVAFKAGFWRKVRGEHRILVLTAIFMVVVILITTEAMARSRAGLILTIVALVGIFAMAITDRRNASGAAPHKLLLGATALAIVLAVQFGLYRIMDRFTVDPLADARLHYARNTIQAAKTFMPLGAGVGTFVPVYKMFEDPNDTFPNVYANHAHNDILEVWLETGLVGMILLVVFVIWIGVRSVKVWMRPEANGSGLDHSLIRAATIVIWILIAHSFVDYPLRTGAMMAIFAFSCALLIAPLATAEDKMAATAERDRIRARRREAQNLPNTPVNLSSSKISSATLTDRTEISDSRLPQPAGRWGGDIDWPAEWQNAVEHKPIKDGSEQ
jgi:O-antigen ligase